MTLPVTLDPFSALLYASLACALLALFTAFVYRVHIGLMSNGTERMQEIGGQIRKGAMAFLLKEYQVIFLFVLIASGLLYLFIDNGMDNVRDGNWQMPFSTASFVTGAFLSVFSGFVGMRSATVANVKTANAARQSLSRALRTAFLSGANMGLTVAGLGLGGLVATLLVLTKKYGVPLEETLEILTAFGFGASSVAMFARVGGGIYTKAADVGADLVGKVEKNIPEDDPRNPAVIADNVGDNVGDVAGMGADLYESFVASTIGAMVLGLTFEGNTEDNIAVLFPLLVAAIGVIASIIGMSFVRMGKGSTNVYGALNRGLYVSSGLVIGGSAFLAYRVFPDRRIATDVFSALVSGLFAGLLIGWLTEYYTSFTYGPTKKLAQASKTGAATIMIRGLALGYMSTALPVLTVCAAIGGAYYLAGLYGVAISAVGMLSTLAMSLAIDAYGPVADNAGGIAEMSKLPKQVRSRTDELDAAGNTTAAVGKGFAVCSAALTAVALFSAFGQAARLDSIDIAQPMVLIGLLIGGMLPFVFGAFLMNAVGRAAFSMIEEVRRQFREIKGLMEGAASGDPARCVSIATGAAIREMILPGFIAITVPIAVGIVLGSHALGGLLAGNLLSGLLLAISMANSGGAWDNAKKYIETGELGGKGSDAHKAAVVGDTVGDPFKDTAGPSINILVKMITIMSLLTVGLYSPTGLL